jgi:hypothetical protein
MKCIYIIAFFLISCANTQNKTSAEVQPQTEIKKEEQVKSFNYPANIFGTDFVNFLGMLEVTQPNNYNALQPYISSVSKSKYSKEAICKWFKTTNLNIKKKLKAIRKLNDSTYILNYVGIEFATRNIKTYTVTIEHDTCKLLIEK